MERFLQPPNTIVIHHSLSEDKGTGDWSDVCRWHYIDHGWSHVGYHYGVEASNGLLTVVKGRPEIFIGAHSVPVNRHSLGVCIVGNFNIQEPSLPTLQTAAMLCRELVERYSIPFHNIKGHRETDTDRTCPGTLFDMNAFRDMVKSITIYRPVFVPQTGDTNG